MTGASAEQPWRVVWLDDALRAARRLDRRTRERIINAIERLEDNWKSSFWWRFRPSYLPEKDWEREGKARGIPVRSVGLCASIF